MVSYKGDQVISEALTRDHKPDDKLEAERILKNNGRIETYKDVYNNSLGPLRVWLKTEDIPGLAMTRSFGDQVAASVGVSCEPELSFLELFPSDKVVILASDGIWEFMSV